MVDRVSEWRSLRADALIDETTHDGVTLAVFQRRPDVMRRLLALIEAERDCCSFLEFRVREQGDRVSVEVSAGRSAR